MLSAHAELTWKIYVNKDYGYSIPLPANLQLVPWKGDPVKFISSTINESIGIGTELGLAPFKGHSTSAFSS